MLQAQSGVCAICKTKGAIDGHHLAIDHDHKNGRIRGLLCSTCNKGLGQFKDKGSLLRAAITYLELHDPIS